MSTTWLSEFGDCQSKFHTFKRKEQRDYAASIANKSTDYLKHEIGEINYPASCLHPRFYLVIYYRIQKDNNAAQQ